MGKYTSVASRLPPLQPQDESYQEKVEQVKTKLRNDFEPNEILRAYIGFRKIRDEQKDKLSAANLSLEAAAQLLIEQFEVEGIESKKLETGEAVSIHPEPYPAVNDSEAFRQWCVKEGLERSMKLSWQSTAAIIKERLLNGDPEPPGVTAYVKQKLSFRKG